MSDVFCVSLPLDVAPVVAHLFDLIGEAPPCASPISSPPPRVNHFVNSNDMV
nr:MAG TPA: hypothetical protein [Caudoviricetes sp.]